MSWFRVDDGFYSHEKVLTIPRAVRAEAIGTWTLCGTWSADKERDGFVPTGMVEELGASPEGARALVTAKLWRRRTGGFVFVNWSEFQFTREELLEKRRAESQRKADYRARKAQESAGASANVPAGQKRDPDHPSRPVPSRPEDLTKTSMSQSSNKRARVSTDSIEVSEMTQRAATQLGIQIPGIVSAIAQYCALDVDAFGALQVSRWLLEKSAEPVTAGQRYVLASIRKSPAEVEQYIHEKGVA